jgi:hypothetical protein
MTGKRLSLASLLLFSAAIPIWISLTYIVITSPGFGGGLHRYYLAPLVLAIASVAIYRLIRGARHAIALSIFLAGIILHGALVAVAIWAWNFT